MLNSYIFISKLTRKRLSLVRKCAINPTKSLYKIDLSNSPTLEPCLSPSKSNLWTRLMHFLTQTLCITFLFQFSKAKWDKHMVKPLNSQIISQLDPNHITKELKLIWVINWWSYSPHKHYHIVNKYETKEKEILNYMRNFNALLNKSNSFISSF